MTELICGQKIKDNDPRMSGRALQIVSVSEHSVCASDSKGYTFRILKRRIYADGKSRRNGFSLVQQ